MYKARAMMHCMTVPRKIWAVALATAVHVRNISLSSVIRWETPGVRWTGKIPKIDHLRLFGCQADVLIPGAKRTQLDARSKNCIFLGYT